MRLWRSKREGEISADSSRMPVGAVNHWGVSQYLVVMSGECERETSAAHRGLELLLTNRFEECQRFLQEQNVKFPGRPRIQSLYALTVFVKGARFTRSPMQTVNDVPVCVHLGIVTFGKAELDESLKCMWAAELVGRGSPTVEGKLVQG